MSRLGPIEQAPLPCDKQDQLINIINSLTSFNCFCELRIKQTMIQKMTEIITIVKRKKIFQKIVLNLSRIILKSTL